MRAAPVIIALQPGGMYFWCFNPDGWALNRPVVGADAAQQAPRMWKIVISFFTKSCRKKTDRFPSGP